MRKKSRTYIAYIAVGLISIYGGYSTWKLALTNEIRRYSDCINQCKFELELQQKRTKDFIRKNSYYLTKKKQVSIQEALNKLNNKEINNQTIQKLHQLSKQTLQLVKEKIHPRDMTETIHHNQKITFSYQQVQHRYNKNITFLNNKLTIPPYKWIAQKSNIHPIKTLEKTDIQSIQL